MGKHDGTSSALLYGEAIHDQKICVHWISGKSQYKLLSVWVAPLGGMPGRFVQGSVPYHTSS